MQATKKIPHPLMPRALRPTPAGGIGCQHLSAANRPIEGVGIRGLHGRQERLPLAGDMTLTADVPALQPAQDADNARFLQSLERICDRLAAKPSGTHDRVIGRVTRAPATEKLQKQYAQDDQADTADAAVLASRTTRASFQGLRSVQQPGALVAVQRAKHPLLIPEPRIVSVLVS